MSIERGAAAAAAKLPEVAADVARQADAVRDELIPRVSNSLCAWLCCCAWTQSLEHDRFAVTPAKTNSAAAGLNVVAIRLWSCCVLDKHF